MAPAAQTACELLHTCKKSGRAPCRSSPMSHDVRARFPLVPLR